MKEGHMLGNKPKIHFVGVGGIGMSGIAELLIKQGFIISGSDMNRSDITDHLSQIGAEIHIGHNSDIILTADIVVKSSAVKDNNPEIVKATAKKIPIIRRAEMLSEIMRMSYGIAIAGTHGKTTTTSMVGTVLQNTGLSPTIIVGGKIMNFGSNNLLGSGKHIVVEADEYDRSFLTLSPIISAITNIEADHLDCYSNLDDIKKAFIEYANKVPFFGCTIVCLDDYGVQSIMPLLSKRVISYGVSRQADVRAVDVHFENFKTSYTAEYRGLRLGKVELNVSGMHNVLNSLMAIAIGLELDISFMDIAKGLKAFTGVFRRFEFKGSFNNISFFDDYAHHPTEIMATLKGVRANTERRIVTLFQPHLYSRTRDFYVEFGLSFFNSDVLLVAPIYPAREEPLKGVSGKLIADAAIQSGHKNVICIEDENKINSYLENVIESGDIVISMGAGNIYKHIEKFIKEKTHA